MSQVALRRRYFAPVTNDRSLATIVLDPKLLSTHAVNNVGISDCMVNFTAFIKEKGFREAHKKTLMV